MRKLDIIRSYYLPKINKALDDYQILGWESEEAQNARFDVLLSNVELNEKSLLDVGCGVGSLYKYLKRLGYKTGYTGVDILSCMIEQAVHKNPNAEFCCMDIFDENAFRERRFDVIYASGIFNLNLGNNRGFLEKALARFYELSGRYIVFNLLHTNSKGKEDTYYYFNPDEVLQILDKTALAFSEVKLVEHYLENDFTVILRK